MDIENLIILWPRFDINNCFSIIFRGEYQELQNKGLKHKNTDTIIAMVAYVHAHEQLLFMCMHICNHSFNDKLACASIVNQFTHQVWQ